MFEIIFLIFISFKFSFCELYTTHLHETCVNLNGRDSKLNKHICEEFGMSPCPSKSGVCNLNPKVIKNASDKEKCLKTLFGFFSTIACDDSKPKDYIYSREDGITTIYVSKDISKLLWQSCSKRATLAISEMIQEDESKRFCKNLTLAKSKVKIRQSINLPGLNKIPIMRLEDVAEIDWLLGGHVNWNLIKLKLSGVLVIAMIILLTLSSIYVRHADIRRKLKEHIDYFEESDDNLIELDLNF